MFPPLDVALSQCFYEESASAQLSDRAARTGSTETLYHDVFIFLVPTWYRSTGSFNPISAKVAKLRQDVILNQIDRSSLYGVISHLYSLPLDGRHVVLRF